jgi:hypothetical protein
MLRFFRGLGLALLGGCSLFTSIDGVSGGAADGPSDAGDASTNGSGDGGGGTPDANGAPDADAATAADADAALPNLQPNGDFELVNGGGCGSEWGVFQGTPTRVGTPRSGTYACKACGDDSSDPNYSLNSSDSANIDVHPGERYSVEAWVRAVDDAGAGQTVRGVIRIYATGTTTVVQRIDPPVVALTTTWTRIDTLLDITAAGDFNYYVSFNGGAVGSCALVDDVVIHRLK